MVFYACLSKIQMLSLSQKQTNAENMQEYDIRYTLNLDISNTEATFSCSEILS